MQWCFISITNGILCTQVSVKLACRMVRSLAKIQLLPQLLGMTLSTDGDERHSVDGRPAGGVTQITAGPNVTISPAGGTDSAVHN